jgi:gliding motility-associated-like protein
MKPRLTLVLALLCFALPSFAQVKFKVKLLTDNTTYQVVLTPDVTWAAPLNAVPSAQVTVVVPTGGFTVGTVTGVAGNWSNNATIVAPSENPGFDYIVFGLQGATSAISFTADVEVPLFEFTNSGSCTGALELIDHATDPFMPPNSQSINVGNQISVIGAGIGVNAYTGNYGAFAADCTPISGCGIEVFDVILTSPSQCGVADGSIEIVATNTNGLPLQYSIDAGVFYQSSPIFTNLAAGQYYEIIVRDIAAICIVNLGSFELNGPLAASVTGVDLVDPTCGQADGSITVNAFSDIGGTLEYGIGATPAWQSSSTFDSLAAGPYLLWVRDIDNNCEDLIGTYILNDCPPEPCLVTFELEYLNNGFYQVNMLTGVTYATPDDTTYSAQVTLKVPTGGFEIANLTPQTPNTNFAINSFYPAPAEEPGFDYITFNLTTTNTTAIPYSTGSVVHLFTFENTGTCAGDSIYLIANDDPFFPPNAQSADVGQQLATSGYGGAMNVCLSANSVAVCGAVPPPAPPTCLITYELEQLPLGAFQVSMTADTTWNFPFNITSSAQWTIKVPAGGFVANNLTSLVSGVNFNLASTYAAPPEDTASDYISVILASPGTQGIPYQQGVKTPLFTFENGGACQGGTVYLMDNDTDPFYPPNSQSANVGQQLTVSGFGGADAPVCVVNQPAEDCQPCGSAIVASASTTICEGDSTALSVTGASGTLVWSPATGLDCTDCPNPTASPAITTTYTVTHTDSVGCESSDQVTVTVAAPPVPGFTANDACEKDTVFFVNTTTSIGTISSWNWDFGDGSTPSAAESPSHIYSISGNFEVSLTVTTGDGCSATASDFVTVFSGPGTAPTDSYTICIGESVQLQAPAAATSATWTPATGLSDSTSLSPMSNPGATTIYTVVATDAGGCSSTDTVTVTVANKPIIVEVNVANQSDCAVADGEIEIAANGTGSLEYSIDNGATWQSNKIFSGLSAGDYIIMVRNGNGFCPIAFNFNPVTLEAPASPTFGSASTVQPSGCGTNDGAALLSGSGGIAPLQYSVDGGVTWQSSGNFANLSPGTYQPVVANSNLTCADAGTSFTLAEPTPATIEAVTAFDPSSCFIDNGSIVISATGYTANSLQFSIDGGASWTIDSLFTLLPAGTYDVAVAYVGGTCVVNYSTQVELNTPADPSITNPVADFSLCENSSASISLQSSIDIQSYTISGTGTWSGDASSGNTLAFDVAPSAGTVTYSVEITGINGCTITEDFAVTELPLPTALFTASAPACTGGQITLDFTGTADAASTLNWSLDGAQIIYSSPATATEPEGATLVVTWDVPGTKNINLMVDQAGCQDNLLSAIDITNFDPIASLDVTDVSVCEGSNGAIDLTTSGSGDYTFGWDGPGVAGDTSQNLTGLAGGAYQVTITETSSGCVATSTATVAAPEPVSIVSVIDQPATDCSSSANNGSLTVQVSGGTMPYSFNLYSTSNLTTPIASLSSSQLSVAFENLSAGAYQVEVNTADGCTDISTATITGVASAFTLADATAGPASCGNTADGVVNITLDGGQSPYTYDVFKNNDLISNDLTLNTTQLTLSDLEPATYVFIFTDDFGCVVPAVVEVGSEVANFNITTEQNSPSCNSSDGSITLTDLPTGATFEWTGTNGSLLPATSDQTGLPTGIYAVTVTDVNGCSDSYSFVLEPLDGPKATINEVLNAFCAGSTGSVTFTVVSDNPFSYIILNGGVSDYGSPGEDITVDGLPEGAYVIEVEDLINSCVTYAAFVVEGTPPLSFVAVATPPGTCGVEDGAICLQISGGVAPYLIESNLGTPPANTVDAQGCVQGLYEGMVTITVTDALGCSQAFQVQLPDMPVVEIAADSVTVNSYTCPGEFGSIVSNTGVVYDIFDENNSYKGQTPWTQVPAGNYVVQYSLGNCLAEVPVEVTGPAEWDISTATQAVSCAGNDGSIALTVGGANGGYTYLWSDSQITATATGLLPDVPYDVVVTDQIGCSTTLSDLSVELDCPCEDVFYVDTFNVVLQPGLNEVCLPTDQPAISIFDLTLDGTAYAGDIGACVYNSYYYGYGALLNLGAPPFRLDAWSYGGAQPASLQFNSISELVAFMNQIDPFGNWVNNSSQSSLSGGSPGSAYGNLIITHIGSNTTLTMQVNTLADYNPSIWVDNQPSHTFVVQDPLTGCTDTLYINILEGQGPKTDTIYVTVPLDGSDTVCLNTTELNGIPELLRNVCESLTLNSQLIFGEEQCIEIQGLQVGQDQACMVLCDDLGVCDTTIVIIDVVDTSTDLVIYNGFSPNEDGVNDYFRIKNIELYPNNKLKVFNRWGNRVYETGSYTNARPWKAIYKGTYLADGTYFYLLDVEINGRMEQFSGYVEVRK